VRDCRPRGSHVPGRTVGRRRLTRRLHAVRCAGPAAQRSRAAPEIELAISGFVDTVESQREYSWHPPRAASANRHLPPARAASGFGDGARVVSAHFVPVSHGNYVNSTRGSARHSLADARRRVVRLFPAVETILSSCTRLDSWRCGRIPINETAESNMKYSGTRRHALSHRAWLSAARRRRCTSTFIAQGQAHPLREQLRSGPQRVGRSERLEAGPLVQAARRFVAARDSQIQVRSALRARPVEDRLQ
jgi:hypothetical protein